MPVRNAISITYIKKYKSTNQSRKGCNNNIDDVNALGKTIRTADNIGNKTVLNEFSEIFKVLDEKSFLEDPSRILSYMMDFGFSRPQTAMLRTVFSDDRRKFMEFLRCTNSDSRKISDNIAEYCMFNSDKLFELLNGIKNALYPEKCSSDKDCKS